MRICIPSIESLPPAARRLAEHLKSALRANESRRRLDPIGNRNRSFLQSLRQITAVDGKGPRHMVQRPLGPLAI